MARRATTFPLILPPRPPGVGVARWLLDALRTEILEGRLRPGERLPATRDLSNQYQFSRGTVGAEAERAAAERGVEVVSLARYARGPLLRKGLQLGFAPVDEKEIRRGVGELRLALSAVQHADGRTPSHIQRTAPGYA